MNTWRKGIASVKIGDTLYISVPFTWLLDEANAMAEKHRGPVKIGGPALMKPNTCEEFEPLLLHNPMATFTTRGCPNRCGFCAVPKLEGDLVELKEWRPAPVICDNNLLAASKKHIRRVVDSLKRFPYADFNQGLDAELFTPEIADMLGEIKCKVRFAFDSWADEKAVTEAVRLCQQRTTNDIGIYCLIGYKDDPDSARARLDLVKSWGLKYPVPMRYQPIGKKEDGTYWNKSEYVAEGWTHRDLQRMMRYYFNGIRVGNIPFDEFEDFGQLTLVEV